MLTNEQIRQIREIVENHHTAFIAEFVAPEFVTDAEIKRLKALGIIPRDAARHSFPEDAYHFNRVVRALTLSHVKDMPYVDYLKWLRRNPIDVTPAEKAAIEYVKNSAALKVRELADTVVDRIVSSDVDDERSQKGEILQRIRDGIAEGIENREGWLTIAGRISDATGDPTQDFFKVAVTEIVDAHQMGMAAELLSENPDVRVAKIPRPDACVHCKRLHLDENTGRPKIFRLSELAGKSNYKKKKADWTAVVEATHPYCMCRLVEIPDGYDFNENWDLEYIGE